MSSSRSNRYSSDTRKGGTKCTSFVNNTLIDPQPANPFRPCYFGQDAIDGNCPRAKSSGQFNLFQCKCLTEQETESLWLGSKNYSIGLGSALLVVSSIIILVMMLKRQQIGDKMGQRGWLVWYVLLAPLSLSGYALYLLISGVLIKTDEYWVGCGQ